MPPKKIPARSKSPAGQFSQKSGTEEEDNDEKLDEAYNC